MSRQRRLILALLACFALLVSACGSDAADVVSDVADSAASTASDAADAVDDAMTDEEEAMEDDAMADEEAMDDEEAVASGDPVVVGMIADLSGPTSDVGFSYAEGQRGYVDFINSQGGVSGRMIDLKWADYAYDTANAEQLYAQYVAEGAVAFMGWGTGDTLVLKESITNDQVPFISASLDETLTVPGESPFNFVPVATYSEQLRVALRYIADQGEPAKVAIFHHDSPFGTSPLGDGEKYIADNGLDIDFNAIPMVSGTTDFTGEIVQAGNPDYVVIQNVPAGAAPVIRDLRTNGSAAQVICLNWCGNEILIEIAGGDAEGVIAAQPFLGPASGAPGLDDIIGHAGEENVDIGYIHGWTAMRTMVEGIRIAAESGEVTGSSIAAALETVSIDTGGLSADINLSAESHAGMFGSPLQVVENGVWVPLSDVIVP